MKRTVLVVDDEANMQTVMRMILEDAGYTVLTAGSGQEALQYIQNPNLDVILSDMKSGTFIFRVDPVALPGAVSGLLDVGWENIDKYGAVAIEPGTQTAMDGDEVVRITGLVEKPPIDEAPSSLAIIGRYVLAPEVFEVLRETAPGRGGEIQLTDALATLVARGEPLHGVVFSGRRYDTGDRLDYLKAVVRLASERDDLGPPFTAFLREFVTELPAEGASPS